MGSPREYIIWTTQLKPLFKSGQRLWVRVYLDHHELQSYMFLKKAILPRRNKHYFEMYQNRRYIAGASSEIQLLVVLQRFHADTWNLVLVHLRKIPRSAWQKYRFSLQLYTKMHGFKYEFSNFFWGGGSVPSPDPPLNLRLRLFWFSDALRPRFGLRPQFTPPTCLITHRPTEGY